MCACPKAQKASIEVCRSMPLHRDTRLDRRHGTTQTLACTGATTHMKAVHTAADETRPYAQHHPSSRPTQLSRTPPPATYHNSTTPPRPAPPYDVMNMRHDSRQGHFPSYGTLQHTRRYTTSSPGHTRMLLRTHAAAAHLARAAVEAHPRGAARVLRDAQLQLRVVG